MSVKMRTSPVTTASDRIDQMVRDGSRHCATCRNCVVCANGTAHCDLWAAALGLRPYLTLAALSKQPAKIAIACQEYTL